MKRKLLTLLLVMVSTPLWAQLYSYKNAEGQLVITDRVMNKKGYKLVAKRVPVEQRKTAISGRGYSENGPNPATTLSKTQIQGLVDPIADAMGVEPELVHAVIQVESSRDYKALSSKGAIGLMQLMPATAERFGISNPWDPRQNIKGGVRYLRFLLSYFEGNVDYALAAYNAGEHAVDKHRGIPPYKETKGYIRKVRHYYKETTLPYNEKLPHRSKLIKEARLEEATKVAKNVTS